MRISTLKLRESGNPPIVVFSPFRALWCTHLTLRIFSQICLMTATESCKLRGIIKEIFSLLVKEKLLVQMLS